MTALCSKSDFFLTEEDNFNIVHVFPKIKAHKYTCHPPIPNTSCQDKIGMFYCLVFDITHLNYLDRRGQVSR